MQTTMAVEDIKTTLPELLSQQKLVPGDEVILTRNRKVVAKLVSADANTQPPSPRSLGCAEG